MCTVKCVGFAPGFYGWGWGSGWVLYGEKEIRCFICLFCGKFDVFFGCFCCRPPRGGRGLKYGECDIFQLRAKSPSTGRAGIEIG